MMAKLIEFDNLLNIIPEKSVISIAGAGGKTTLMFRLARALSGYNVVTTTTKVGINQITQADARYTFSEFSPDNLRHVMWVSPSLEPANGKINGFMLEDFSRLAALRYTGGFSIINEADGAAQRHIKAPASHEPVIPSESNICIYTIGLDVIGKPLNNGHVHRPNIFAELTGLDNGNLIDVSSVRTLLDHPEGGLKGFPENAFRVVYLTHADTEERYLFGKEIGNSIRNYDYVCINK